MASASSQPQHYMLKQKLREAQWVERQLQDVGAQVSVLRMRGAYLEQSSVGLATFLRLQFEQIAKAETSALSDAIQRTLPRELRDLIYTYLIGGACQLDSERTSEKWQALNERTPALDHLLTQHYMKESYVGTDFHGELIQHFYERATLCVMDDIATKHGDLYQENDSFGSTTLLCTRIRNVVFFVENPRAWNESKNHFKHGLEALKELAGRGCKVTVQLRQEADVSTANILSSLGPEVRDAESAGLKFLVRCGNNVIRWEDSSYGDGTLHEGRVSESV